jgi:hypothetical protein
VSAQQVIHKVCPSDHAIPAHLKNIDLNKNDIIPAYLIFKEITKNAKDSDQLPPLPPAYRG